ncbi:MAG: hypothetical protein V2I38_09050 [Alcanivoracaceae bacterium]|jgi:hypothetical protein|nr:hypothetical protein [Alcanivoracaceae bacterium]
MCTKTASGSFGRVGEIGGERVFTDGALNLPTLQISPRINAILAEVEE